MSRRRDYLSFLARRKGRGEFIFAHEGSRRWRWIIPALLIAAAGGFAFWWFGARAPEAETSGAGVATMPTILQPVSTTTMAGGDSAVGCPPVEDAGNWPNYKATPARTGCVEAPTISTPAILWAAKVGVQGWLNNPVVVGDTVYVASAGDLELESDAADGVYALDLEAGTRRWFFNGSLDVNGVAANEELVVATGDEGLVWGIDAETGLALWTANLGTAVFTNPLLVDGKAIVGDQSGTITAFDLGTGLAQWRVTVAGAVRGGAAFDGERIFAVGEQREVVALGLDGRIIWRETITPRTGEGENLMVFAAPVVAGDVVVISLVREEVFGDPALVALNRETGDVAWWATDAAGIKTEWGSVRSSPAVVGNTLVYGEGYSGSLVAVNAADGKTLWAAEVGPLCYRQWASPAVVSGQVILPRYDGGLYAVDVASQLPVWSIYLGQQSLEGAFPADFDAEFCGWEVRSGSSVLASPAVAGNGTILVGSLEGYLYAVGNGEE